MQCWISSSACAQGFDSVKTLFREVMCTGTTWTQIQRRIHTFTPQLLRMSWQDSAHTLSRSDTHNVGSGFFAYENPCLTCPQWLTVRRKYIRTGTSCCALSHIISTKAHHPAVLPSTLYILRCWHFLPRIDSRILPSFREKNLKIWSIFFFQNFHRLIIMQRLVHGTGTGTWN